ncbi:Uma2 family endonuclease [Sorangium cellulosum]|uniref:Uma2 family endonuclease n=1 Tax=Sorangium cellulosum TaxID=56 RepID=UPI003D9A7B3F
MADPARRLDPATMADLEALPPHVKGEIIEGVLYTHPRPRSRHQRVLSLVGHELIDPYDRSRSGPGGWWILPEPGIELPGSPEFSPDIAGWKRERLAELPDDEPIRIAPDWVCEIFSPRMRSYTQGVKRPFYARIGVGWLWYVDLDAQTFTWSRLHEGKWLELGVVVGEARVRAEPFDAVEIDVAEWWTSGRASGAE